MVRKRRIARVLNATLTFEVSRRRRLAKNARILWAVMTRGEAFDANHLSVKATTA